MGAINTFMNWRTAAHTGELVQQGRRSAKAQRNAARRDAGMYVGPLAGIVNFSRSLNHGTPIEAERRVHAWFPPAEQVRQAEPGWYVPHGELQRRWWDGTKWTEHTYPLPIEK